MKTKKQACSEARLLNTNIYFELQSWKRQWGADLAGNGWANDGHQNYGRDELQSQQHQIAVKLIVNRVGITDHDYGAGHAKEDSRQPQHGEGNNHTGWPHQSHKKEVDNDKDSGQIAGLHNVVSDLDEITAAAVDHLVSQISGKDPGCFDQEQEQNDLDHGAKSKVSGVTHKVSAKGWIGGPTYSLLADI